jgi:hypothetical protein
VDVSADDDEIDYMVTEFLTSFFTEVEFKNVLIKAIVGANSPTDLEKRIA